MKLIPSTKIMRFSVLAFIVTLVLGLLGMGFLGIGLLFLVSPFLAYSYAEVDAMSGDWVWPALILSGMVWSLGFLFAGWLNLYLSKLIEAEWHKSVWVIIYVLVLYLWAFIIWALILNGRPS